jgi:hypothetical protein
MVVAPGAEQFEDREAALVDHDDLAIDEAGLDRQACDGIDDAREAVGEVVAIAREQTHALAIAPRQDAEAVVLDLMNPPGAGGRLLGGFGKAGRDGGPVSREGGTTHGLVAGSLSRVQQCGEGYHQRASHGQEQDELKEWCH